MGALGAVAPSYAENLLLNPKILEVADVVSTPKRSRTAMKVNASQNALKWLGFEEADFSDGGSDRLVDAIVAWGDESALRERIQAHWDAGADHVCIQPLRADGEGGPDLRALEALAPNA